MKGNPEIITLLNEFLADELTAINQYMVHSEMCDAWGYDKLHKAVEKRAIDEMKHAEKLIGRILTLGGTPIVSELNKFNIGDTVQKQIENDLAAECGAIEAYNKGIALCIQKGDNGSRQLIDDNLKDEEDHLGWLEMQLDQIQQMGVQNYLQAQSE